MADNWTTPLDWSSGAVLTETQLDEQLRDNLTAVFNALTADASADSAIWHGHKSGTLASRPAAAHAGRTYLATDLGVTFTDFGTRWEIGTVHPRIAEHFFDEFMLSRAGSGTWTTNASGETLPWALNITGTGGFTTFGSPDRSRLGMLTGTTSGSTATMGALAAGTHYQMDLTSDRVPAFMYHRYATSATTDQTVLFGIADGGGATPNGVYWKRTDTGTPGNWRCITRAAGVETNTDSGVAGDTNYHDFEIFINAVGNITFYLDGTLEATHTTNIPTTTDLSLQHYITNAAAAAKQLNMDRIDWIARR